MARKAAEKVAAAKEDIQDLEEDYKDLENELRETLEEVKEKWEMTLEDLSERAISPRKTDIKVDFLALAWHPYWEAPGGSKSKRSLSTYFFVDLHLALFIKPVIDTRDIALVEYRYNT